MPGKYCRGCGRHKEVLKVPDPRYCKTCGPLLVYKREFCEHCGGKLHTRGQDPCPHCYKKAYRFFGR
jgi:hypothetical protein